MTHIFLTFFELTKDTFSYFLGKVSHFSLIFESKFDMFRNDGFFYLPKSDDQTRLVILVLWSICMIKRKNIQQNRHDKLQARSHMERC